MQSLLSIHRVLTSASSVFWNYVGLKYIVAADHGSTPQSARGQMRLQTANPSEHSSFVRYATRFAG